MKAHLQHGRTTLLGRYSLQRRLIPPLCPKSRQWFGRWFSSVTIRAFFPYCSSYPCCELTLFPFRDINTQGKKPHEVGSYRAVPSIHSFVNLSIKTHLEMFYQTALQAWWIHSAGPLTAPLTQPSSVSRYAEPRGTTSEGPQSSLSLLKQSSLKAGPKLDPHARGKEWAAPSERFHWAFSKSPQSEILLRINPLFIIQLP